MPVLNPKYKFAAKLIISIISAIAVLWVLACVAIYHTMRQPPERFGYLMTKVPQPAAFLVLPFETLWMRARAGTLKVGDRAPDFSLAKIDKTEQIRLSNFAAQGKPVVLVFGSYT